jgi:hypothetical protein
MAFVTTMHAEDGLWIASAVPTESGLFTSTDKFSGVPPGETTWSFLLDGAGDVLFFGYPAVLVGLCFEVTPPSAEVESVVLVIDAEFPVPTTSSTWGRIKALYR